MVRSYYDAPSNEFCTTHPDQILGTLAREHHHPLEGNQKNAWLEQVKILKSAVRNYPKSHLFLEFSIPRMGKRADAVLVINGYILVIEFKVGATHFDRDAIEQRPEPELSSSLKQNPFLI